MRRHAGGDGGCHDRGRGNLGGFYSGPGGHRGWPILDDLLQDLIGHRIAEGCVVDWRHILLAFAFFHTKPTFEQQLCEHRTTHGIRLARAGVGRSRLVFEGQQQDFFVQSELLHGQSGP